MKAEIEGRVGCALASPGDKVRFGEKDIFHDEDEGGLRNGSYC
jgi:hypothetical protein